MKIWLVIVSVVAALLAVAAGVGFSMWSDTKVELASMETRLAGLEAELAEIRGDSPSTYTLDVRISPLGGGSVSPSGGEYEPGELVTLTANSDSDYTFDYWDGASGSSNVVTITMDSDKTVIAYFKLVVHPPTSFVNWYEAKNYIGERVTVCGPVKSTYYSSGSKGKPTFLNIGELYPDPDRFTVIIWGENRNNFPEPPESYYEGKDICVTGLIVSYEGIPEIEVASPDQIEIQ